MGREDQIISERLRKLKELKEQGINPYPSKPNTANRSFSAELQKKYKKLKPESHKSVLIKIAGRLMNTRDLGKIIFGTIQDNSGNIQITTSCGAGCICIMKIKTNHSRYSVSTRYSQCI